jgi:hypothetical protein
MSPRTPRSQDTANAILSQTSVTIPAPITPNNRWSVQSGQSDFDHHQFQVLLSLYTGTAGYLIEVSILTHHVPPLQGPVLTQCHHNSNHIITGSEGLKFRLEALRPQPVSNHTASFMRRKTGTSRSCPIYTLSHLL